MDWRKLIQLLAPKPGRGGSKSTPDKSRLQVARVPRVSVLPLHNLALRLSAGAGESKGELAVAITNISSSGVGLQGSGISPAPEAGGRVQGTLVVGQERLSVVLHVVHVSPAVIGCAFVDPSAELRAAIIRYLEVELHALDMKEVDPAFLKAEAEGTPHWFQGRNNCELFYVTDPESHLVRFSAVFFGNVVEGGRAEPTRFGQVVDATMDEEVEFKPGYKASALVSWGHVADPNVAELAQRFLKSVNGLDARHLSSILDRVGETGQASARK